MSTQLRTQIETTSTPVPSLTVTEHKADRIAEAIVSGSALPRAQVTPKVTSLKLQRVCPRAPTHIGRTGSLEPCTRSSARAVSGGLLYFCLDSIELEVGQETWLNNLLVGARVTNRIEIHGNASTEGPKEGDYNYNNQFMLLRSLYPWILYFGKMTFQIQYVLLFHLISLPFLDPILPLPLFRCDCPASPICF